MALDESTENLDKLESNGVSAYIEKNLKQLLDQMGDINVDFVDNGPGQRGFTIKVGSPDADCSSGGCKGCG